MSRGQHPIADCAGSVFGTRAARHGRRACLERTARCADVLRGIGLSDDFDCVAEMEFDLRRKRL